MRRRDFMAAVGGAIAWPAANAQQAGRLPIIGFLGANPAGFAPWTAAFVARLRELGWVDGRTVAIEYRWSEGRTERCAEIAAEFAHRKVDVIVTVGSAVPSVRQAAGPIPIVFAVAIDPVRSGLVSKLDVALLEIRRMQDIASVFEKLNSQADALYIVVDQLIVANFHRILTFALSTRLPMIYSTRDFVSSGGLMSYGPSYVDLFRRAGDYVDRILKGAKPGEMPVEQPTRFELVLNLTTARALGLRVPEPFLLRVDEVIE